MTHYGLNKYNLVFFFLIALATACAEKKTKLSSYPNGQTEFECEIKAGKRTGTCFRYYQNGKLYSVSGWKNDVLAGATEIYYENGILKQKTFWENGRENGLFEEYYPGGVPKEQSHFVNGNPVGLSRYYHSNGRLASQRFWGNVFLPDKDTIVNATLWTKEYDTKGKLISKQHIVDVKASKIENGYYQLNVRLEGAMFEKISLYVGNFDSNYRLVGKCDTVESSNLDAVYLYKSEKTGKNIIRGVIRDWKRVSNPSGSQNTWESFAYFTYELNADTVTP